MSPQSKVTRMFDRYFGVGRDPEARYTKAIVRSVAISGRRASLIPELYYIQAGCIFATAPFWSVALIAPVPPPSPDGRSIAVRKATASRAWRTVCAFAVRRRQQSCGSRRSARDLSADGPSVNSRSDSQRR